MVRMIKEEMKVGPKGQVVIPKVFRRIMKIYPGSRVLFELKGNDLVIERVIENPVEVFERIAKKGKPVSKIDSDKLYEERMRERWKRAG